MALPTHQVFPSSPRFQWFSWNICTDNYNDSHQGYGCLQRSTSCTTCLQGCTTQPQSAITSRVVECEKILCTPSNQSPGSKTEGGEKQRSHDAVYAIKTEQPKSNNNTELQGFKPNDPVYIQLNQYRSKWIKGTVIKLSYKNTSGCSYKIQTETGGVNIRNWKFIKPRKDNRVQEIADQTTHIQQ